ncbi:MAG TPA: ferric reductase-like transmembrane domain-containing protein, partial [Polyangiaceae bacterium]|nr:ferric reductase-like transmembrane domain-containing protein [Polyangiaceae bacterium]
SLSVRPWVRLHARLRGSARGSWLVWRRLLGMTSAWLALLHAGIALRTELADVPALLSWPHLRAGAAALAILCALLLTSFPTLVVRLRFRLWQELHRLVYAAALLALQHLLLAPFAPRLFTLALFAATFLFGFLRWL